MASEARKQAASEQLFDGRFILGDVIGRGRQSIVYKAEQINPPTPRQKIVALKLVFGGNKDREGVLRRIRREALGMLASRSAHTIRLYDYVLNNEQPYLVMEFADRGDLKAYATRKGGSLDFEEAVEITIQTLEGLAAVHRAGMIHRDIKAENVLISGHKTVKLADFSIASVPTEYLSLEKANPVVGTFDYLAPESLNNGESSSRSDLYSVAMTLYELLTGIYPFGDGPFSEQVQRKLAASWTPLPQYLNPVPPLLPDLFRVALASDPKERFATAEEFIDALKAVRSGEWQPPKKATPEIRLPVQEGLLAPENDEADGQEQDDHHFDYAYQKPKWRWGRIFFALLFLSGVFAGGTYLFFKRDELQLRARLEELLDRIQSKNEEQKETVQEKPLIIPPIDMSAYQEEKPEAPTSIIPTFSVRLAQYPGLLASVLVSIPDSQSFASPRLIVEENGNSWSFPLLAQDASDQWLAVFPTPKSVFQLSIAAEVNGKILRSAALPVEIDCQTLQNSDGENENNEAHPLLDRSLKLAAQVDALSYALEVSKGGPQTRETPPPLHPPAAPKSTGNHRFRCLMSNPSPKLLSLGSEQLQELMELRSNKADILEKQLADAKTESKISELNQRAEQTRISDRGPLFSPNMSQADFISRLALLGAAEDAIRMKIE